MERKDIQQNYKWNTADVFPSDEAWEEEFQSVEKEYCNYDFSVFYGKLGEKETLLNCLNLSDEIGRRIEKLYIYAHLRCDEDVRVSETNAKLARTQALYSKLVAQLSFIDPQLTELSEETLNGFIADPDFVDFDYRLKRVAASKSHVLSEGEERLLALSGNVFGGFQTVFMMLNNANLNLPKATYKGEEVQMSHGMYGVVLHTGTAEERKEWFEKYYESYVKLIDAITQTYYNNVKKNVLYKTVRNFDSCLAMALDGEDVQPKVYENLIKATRDALPAMHEYVSLRKKVLGLDEQHMYDLYIPLVEAAEIALPFEEAYQMVIKGLAPLGKDYQALLQRGVDERWIDVYENEGKRSGAYSTGTYDAPHPYVLLNYQSTTNDMFTIAHEMGHALHTYKSTQAQPYSKANYTIFLAEIASTVNEVLLLKYLYSQTTDKNLKKYLLNYYMDMFRTTLFRQTHFAEFEQIAHEKAERGEALTKEELCKVYYELNQKYYGEGVTHDSQIAYEWARIPHFYNAFYVYKYATGITSAISIVKRILTEGDSAVKDYFAFLSSGGCEDPVSILKKAGVDLTTEAPFEAAMQEFKNTLEEFKSLL
jgi:oligoendopeptidase F